LQNDVAQVQSDTHFIQYLVSIYINLVILITQLRWYIVCPGLALGVLFILSVGVCFQMFNNGIILQNY